MKRLFLMGAFALFVCTASFSQSIEDKAYVDVSAFARAKVVPDRAEIEITLKESDNKGRYSMDELEKRLAVALNEAGVDAEKQLSLYRQYVSTDKKRRIYQYKTFKLVVYNAEEAQIVMDALTAQELSNTRILRTWCEDYKQISDSLKVAAVKNAASDAKVLAGSLNQSIGSALRISYYASRYSGGAVRNTVMLAAKADTASEEAGTIALPKVEFDEIEIEESVNIRFELLPAGE